MSADSTTRGQRRRFGTPWVGHHNHRHPALRAVHDERTLLLGPDDKAPYS